MPVSDITGQVKTTRPALPQVYAYTTPEIARHEGWTKIGYTEQDVKARVEQQTHTAGVKYVIHWHGNAVYEGSGETFRDSDFHGYLKRLGIGREAGTEWFEIEPDPAKMRFYEFRESRGVLEAPAAIEYKLRCEQEKAVEQAAAYAKSHGAGEFLWNAKPRFGKTLTSYDLCKKLGARKVLIVTNRPAIANSWYEDYVRFLGRESGLCFVSDAEALRGKPYCMTYEEFLKARLDARESTPAGFIEFVSLQNLKGSIHFGGGFEKLEEVADLDWDVLIIDEAHEGVDTLKTDVAFDRVKRGFTLHLSGTPFKAIANDKFPEDAIFNWTYADEQKAKAEWPEDAPMPNPYEDLPKLNLFTYQMGDIVAGKVAKGAEIEGESVEYAFDLNEFFATSRNGSFTHGEEVDRFLDALTTQTKFPFSTPALRDELRHTFWMLNRVDSAKALAKRLKRHPVFGEYEIVLAAGDGKLDDEGENAKAYDKVRNAIAGHDRTITLSVGQLTTGVTVPEWTAVLMLSNMKSPALYMQAAFRAQNPCLFKRGGGFFRKENAYVFDFDPARTLTVFEQFANDLYSDTSAGGGSSDDRKRRIRTLLNFFPVIGEDDKGEMVELDAERVLSIPRRIRSREVVRRGFMSDFLFQNIGSVFRAPAEVLDVLQTLEPHKASKADLGIGAGTADELGLNEQGDVELSDELVVGKSSELFGDKLYGIKEELDEAIDSIQPSEGEVDEDKEIDELAKALSSSIAGPLVESARKAYSKEDLRPQQRKRIERAIESEVEAKVGMAAGEYKINRNLLKKERDEGLEAAESHEEADAVNARFEAAVESEFSKFRETVRKDVRGKSVESAAELIVETVEKAKRENKKRTVEEGVRDRLRGFSRTIPSFLMAYGDEGTTLEGFDKMIPDDVFLEVTGITVEQFRFLRDGGEFENEETGETEHFEGGLFDPVVFNDSVAEFIALRSRLADYFDETLEEDIFDYVPPQKTNQIFTPKAVVREMVDLFEKENPGCFDDPTHTFADLYMKSGTYITEIVKRLYRSEGMRAAYPDDHERLAHILEHQVYGAAPTEIIYQIATHYILGYDGEVGGGLEANFVCADTAQLAKEGKLAEWVEQTFGPNLTL